MTSLKDYLTSTRNRGSALGAFNLDSLEMLKAVSLAAQKLNAPVIAEVSPKEAEYLGLDNVVSLVNNARRELNLPLYLNLDHAEDKVIIKNAIELGFAMVHFDGAKLPLTENTKLTKELVNTVHSKNVLVEGDIDSIGGRLTDPLGAKRFVEETGVDIFAVSIGNKHGVGENEKLDLGLLQKIRRELPETFFSLHGGSGISPEDIRAATGLGVVKINVNTELRIAWREKLAAALAENPQEYAWYNLTQAPIAELQRIVEDKIKIFGAK
jgi:fructose-bisphosphate aldolase class II